MIDDIRRWIGEFTGPIYIQYGPFTSSQKNANSKKPPVDASIPIH